ncbi:MAG: DUF2764 family protein [bacterium]
MSNNYYYLISGLPEISFDQLKLGFTLQEFKNNLEENLEKEDLQLVELIFLQEDNVNLINFLEKKDRPFKETGNYSKEELEEGIKEPGNLPIYMQDFMHAYKEDAPIFPGLSLENQLTTLYYNYVLDTKNEFLFNWFEFSLNLGNAITAINCRIHNIPTGNQIIGNNYVAQNLKKSNARDFGLGDEIPYIEKLNQLFEGKIAIEREREIDLIKWQYLDEATIFEYFSTEEVLSYTIKLRILSRWMKLDPETGKVFFSSLLKELENSFEFPKEFALK